MVGLLSQSEISSDEIYVNPILPFGVAIITPLVIGYIIIEYKAIIFQLKLMFKPIREMDYGIFIFTVVFLFIQLAINALLMICLVLIEPDLLNTSEYTPGSSIIIWGISLGFAIGTTLFNIFIGKRWVNSEIQRPHALHWFFGYVIFGIGIVAAIITVEALYPAIKGILLWPLPGIMIIGALSYFVVAFGLFLVGLDFIISPVSTGQSDAWIGFVFMMGIFFMALSVFLLFIHMVTFYFGVYLGKSTKRRKEVTIE
jgi:hypothetical protein